MLKIDTLNVMALQIILETTKIQKNDDTFLR